MGFDSGAYQGNSGQRPQQPRPPYSGQWPPPPQQPQWQQPPPGWQPPGQPGPYRQPPRRRRGGAGWIFGTLCLGAVVIVIAIVAAAHGKTPQASASSPAVTGAPAATQAASSAAASTITFVVTGSPADVTWGPEGSSLAGKVPMHQVEPLGSPLYYSITAQLQGSGAVTCKILINGQPIAQSVATGGYNIALCEVSRDPLTGQWSDTQSGA